MGAVSLWLTSLLSAAAADPMPPVPGRWERIDALWDEFDGEQLDADKWFDHNPGWKGRQPAWFAPHNVSVHDGALHLVARAETLPDLPEGYHTFTTAAVKSKALVRYGYFEARCRAMRSRASSAFWFYEITPEIWTEIDVFEIGAASPGNERTIFQTLHVWHTPEVKEHFARGHQHRAEFDPAADFHDYGLLWTPERIVYYLDGEPVHEQENTHWHQPLALNFDSETFPDWFGLPDPAELPATFSIDYIRAWRVAAP